MSYSYTGTARMNVRGVASPGVVSAAPYAYPSYTGSYTGVASRSAATPYNRGTYTTATAPAVTTARPMGRPATYAASNYMASPARGVLPTGTATISTSALPATTIGTARIAAQPMTTFGTNYGAAPRVYASQVAATYIGGTPISTASANLLAQGTVVSERIIPVQEAYTSGLVVRSEAGMQQPIYLEPAQTMYGEVVIQPTEVMVGGQFLQGGQVLQAGEPVFQQLQEQQYVEQPMEVLQAVDMQGQGEMVQAVEQAAGAPRVVIVCTSCAQLGDLPTGAWSEEITGPYYVFREAGCEVYIASIEGGVIPLDQGSLAEGTYTENDRRFQEEGGLQLLDSSPAISQISAEDIDCVWLAGGHGAVIDFEAALAQFVTDAVAYQRPVGAVCHGVIGLLSAINQDGTPLLAGRQVTGFSNAEEDMVGLSDKVPFLVQNRMQELGALYSCGEPWSEYALADQLIITGQNPQSSVRTAQLCVQAMMQQPTY